MIRYAMDKKRLGISICLWLVIGLVGVMLVRRPVIAPLTLRSGILSVVVGWAALIAAGYEIARTLFAVVTMRGMAVEGRDGTLRVAIASGFRCKEFTREAIGRVHVDGDQVLIAGSGGARDARFSVMDLQWACAGTSPQSAATIIGREIEAFRNGGSTD